MKTTHAAYIAVLMLCFFSTILMGQSGSFKYWDTSNASKLDYEGDQMLLGEIPDSYSLVNLDLRSMQAYLESAPKLEDGAAVADFIISIPDNQGVANDFVIQENNNIDPSVAHLYSIRTFQGVATGDSESRIRCDVSDAGFHAYVFAGGESYIVEPAFKNSTEQHIIYKKSDLYKGHHSCETLVPPARAAAEMGTSSRSTMLRNYRIAMVAAGEYSEQFGGNPCNKTTVLNSMVSGLNMVNAIYNKDLGVQLNIITNNDLVYCDSGSDPFDPYGNQITMIGINQTECDRVLTNAGYDVGHLMVWANTGGVAYTGVICYTGFKAQGFSGSSSSVTTLFVDYAGHEIGHQFNGQHNFVSDECGTSEDDYRFEPGEGSSIMAYAGVCGAAASYQGNSDPYFHTASLDDMNTYITQWGGCATLTSPGSGNIAAPVINALSNIVIPRQTPFVLSGTASDANDGTAGMTYLWEQHDGTSVARTGSPDCNSTTDPLFKFQDPVSDPFRVFPDMTNVLGGNNANVPWEKLPCASRTMNFRMVARDNNANWGRVTYGDMTVQVMNTGPFAVTVPNGGETYNQGELVDINWDVNSTDTHCASVDIMISMDSGQTYSMLKSSVTNNGSSTVTIPNANNNTSRILVQCSTGNTAFRGASTFFDVSDSDFAISVTLPVRLLSFNAYANKEQIDVVWSTAEEKDMDVYHVEKSFDGSTFERIGSVKSKEYSSNNYEFIDVDPRAGIQYYRLQQMDLDARYSYSDIISVRYGTDADAAYIYPNPSSDYLRLGGFIHDSIVDINIYNAEGKVVKRLTMSANEAINIKDLTVGVYFIEISEGPLRLKKKFFKI